MKKGGSRRKPPDALSVCRTHILRSAHVTCDADGGHGQASRVREIRVDGG
jgi:hypothetical protein